MATRFTHWMLLLGLGAVVLLAAPSPATAVWTEIDKLLASDATGGDIFGYSVGISGDYAIVGAKGDGSYSGSAYVFQRFGSSWAQVAKLTASDAASSDYFGNSVGISGDDAIVGAYGNDDSGMSSGSAYVFERPAGGWTSMTETAKLTASDAAMDDVFGNSVGISGDAAIVGAHGDDDGGVSSGSAYVFERPASGWTTMTETAKLTASDSAWGDSFGVSVAISGDDAIVGATGDDDSASKSGSAYVFERPAGGWTSMTETAKLTASDAAQDDNFGWSVGISGDDAIVGAFQDDDGGSKSGSAYVFESTGGGWTTMTETAKLTASDAAQGDWFGQSVAISGDDAIVGAGYDGDAGSDSGSAYVFESTAGIWTTTTETAKLTASDAAAYDLFGWSVGISGDDVIVGAYGNGDNGDWSGSAYVYSASEEVIPEPASLLIFGGLFLIFAAAGYLRRRRNRSRYPA